MMPSGIDLILADHRMVNELFDEFDSKQDGATVGLIVAALAAHDEAEHAALYPFASAVLDDVALIQRSAAAHSMVKKQVDMMANLEGAPLIAACSVLKQLVTEHVDDEESNLLPALADVATPQQLDALGARFLQAKQRGG
jgi:hemerythrin superfamily protein